MTVAEQLQSMVVKLQEAIGDAHKFESRGVDAAGKRIRKTCLEVAKEAKELRGKIQELRNG